MRRFGAFRRLAPAVERRCGKGSSPDALLRAVGPDFSAGRRAGRASLWIGREGWLLRRMAQRSREGSSRWKADENGAFLVGQNEAAERD